jgi:hypothetical protein
VLVLARHELALAVPGPLKTALRSFLHAPKGATKLRIGAAAGEKRAAQGHGTRRRNPGGPRRLARAARVLALPSQGRQGRGAPPDRGPPAPGLPRLRGLRVLPRSLRARGEAAEGASQVGPMAQDFRAASGLGKGGRRIDAVDAAA